MKEFENDKHSVQLLLILNGCTDNSLSIAKKLESSLDGFIKVYHFPEKIGKGGAILEGFKISTADHVCFADVDCAVPPSEIKKLYDNIGQFDCIIGSRHLRDSKIYIKQSLSRRMAGRIFNFICRSLFGFDYRDTQCGGKIFKKETLKSIIANVTDTGWAFDVDLLICLYNEGFSVREFPINWYHDDQSKIKLVRDGLKMLQSILQVKFKKGNVQFKRYLFLQHHYKNQGTYLRAIGFAKELAKLETHIHVVCINDRKCFGIEYEELVDNPYVLIIKLPRFFQQNSPLDLLMRLPFSVWVTLKQNYSLLYSFALGMPTNSLPTLLFKWFRHGRIVVDWDDLWYNGYGRYTGKIGNFLFYLFERLSLKVIHPKKVTCVSEFLSDKFKEEGISHDKISIIGNGIDDGHMYSSMGSLNQDIKSELKKKYGLSTETKMVVSVGNTYGTSFENMIQAFKRASSGNEHLKLFLLGKFLKGGKVGEEVENVIKKNRDLFLSKVIILGHVSSEDYFNYLKMADCALLPMEDTDIDRARFPIRLGDYVRFRLPIISNSTGEVARILKQYRYGLTCNVADLDQFAENIVNCAKNPERFFDPQVAQEILTHELNWSKNSKTLSSIFQSAIL